MCGKKVALYCRVAHKDQHAMDTQYERLKQFAAGKGLVACVPYLDNGYSGMSGGRPAFKEMNADIASGKVGTVVSVDVSRVGRRVDRTRLWLAFIDQHKVSVVFADDSARAVAFTAADKKEGA